MFNAMLPHGVLSWGFVDMYGKMTFDNRELLNKFIRKSYFGLKFLLKVTKMKATIGSFMRLYVDDSISCIAVH